MIHFYYRRLQDWSYSSVLHLHVITYQHCQYIQKMYPPKEHSKQYTLYYHQMEVHIPEINRLFHLLHLTSENEGIYLTSLLNYIIYNLILYFRIFLENR